ncbi:hypothetical protein GCM10011613_22090 [Cellvibrio zantedeschiae]|uniref:DUF6249 domain-containing protein n=1 Tax=Cellvibrio zantedeschiae TaxID=1237077 RepID=A0ABQ3B6G1_9GAMM|nr:DUF6249 domain-containing protein [Cellvibrio zantedeschiae]GGY77159.1 hypothetical protein GCM10011613_22090 [Cellvibrio zantedeschiae]
MRIIPLAHQALRKLALIGLLLTPFSLSHAAELVGKPVPVGASGASTAAHSAAAAPVPPVEAVVPPAPVDPIPPVPDDVESAHDDMRQAMEDMRRDFHQDFGHEMDGFNMSPDLLIPIVAMSLLFGGPVLLLIILAFLHYRAKSRRQHNINANIDKLLAAGRDIPVELLLGEEPAAVKRNVNGEVTVYHNSDENMQKGVRNVGLGIGWLIFLTIMFGIKIGAFGFVFIGLGLSQVIIWKLSGTSVSPTPSTDIARVQE